MKNEGISTVKIAATFIGTVVGAGFESGQETLRFFLVFGRKGIWGLTIVAILFVIYGYIIMSMGRKLQTQSQLEIIQYAGGKKLGTVIDYIITFFIFGALVAMIAGAGAIPTQMLNVSNIWGNIIIAIIAALTVMSGMKGIVNAISVVVPFLILGIFGVSIASFTLPPDNIQVNLGELATGLNGNWFWSALLYASYNLVLSVGVLGILGVYAKDNKSIKWGAVLGGVGLGLGSMAIYFALSNNLGGILDKEIPMIYIAGRISYIFQLIYLIILVAEIYTTAVGSLYSLAIRITGMDCPNRNLFIVCTACLALLASQTGFVNIVKFYYPIMGYGGLILLVCLLKRGVNLSFGYSIIVRKSNKTSQRNSNKCNNRFT